MNSGKQKVCNIQMAPFCTLFVFSFVCLAQQSVFWRKIMVRSRQQALSFLQQQIFWLKIGEKKNIEELRIKSFRHSQHKYLWLLGQDANKLNLPNLCKKLPGKGCSFLNCPHIAAQKKTKKTLQQMLVKYTVEIRTCRKTSQLHSFHEYIFPTNILFPLKIYLCNYI